MRNLRRFLAVAIVCAVPFLQVQPRLWAASPSPRSQGTAGPSAIIISAKLAHVGKADAVMGTTIFPGDVLDTAPTGGLRLAVGMGQVYLLSGSAANILNSGSILRAALVRGTIGFSSLTGKQFQIITPEGIVEAAGGLPVYGQVTTTGVEGKDIVISAYAGALVLRHGSETLVVKAGQSYYVALVPDDSRLREGGVVPPYNYHLVWRLVVVGTAAGVGYFLWQQFSVSPSVP